MEYLQFGGVRREVERKRGEAGLDAGDESQLSGAGTAGRTIRGGTSLQQQQQRGYGHLAHTHRPIARVASASIHQPQSAHLLTPATTISNQFESELQTLIDTHILSQDML